ncbi:copper resistance system multicopper oxidase [Sphingomonas sp. So64.6b]|uniref:copper resistance system multicopper oxidase n=1 Tax=Sphingomonas sp. So64.6b TaxID=2997354 RepID=UPI001603B4DD|nr:copper resistance system multicopper oxidase [Sphingomonas sp. So64.6b]QNA85517.1 copper resistance system multicopper oxidase [Sphingomonas sp. So64.6b]
MANFDTASVPRPLILARRTLLRSALGIGAVVAFRPSSGWSATPSSSDVLSGDEIRLSIAHRPLTIGGRRGHGVLINGSLPGPLIRLREGRPVRLVVSNGLQEDTSIHWHGLLVPFQFDGVPGVSFPGIRPGETFTYDFTPKQAGTYWYHSHSGMQEQEGTYGAIVIDPAGNDPVASDREHVIVLSDWSSLHGHALMRKLKQDTEYFNYQRQTITGLIAARDQKLRDRLDWGRMRMEPTDISDVTGATYSYLLNGQVSAQGWTGLFTAAERVRLRVINASSMTNFNFRLAGLAMTVVQSDGQNVRPVKVDELQIAVAETYDVIVEPAGDRAYAVVAEAVDRSGMVWGMLSPRIGMTPVVPTLRKRPILGMIDMGMDMGTSDGAAMDMSMRNPVNAPGVILNPGVATLAPMATNRTREPGVGLADVGHRVLNYGDLVALTPNPDPRPPERKITVHLTGNMESYVWAFDGVKFSDRAPPLAFKKDERVRVTLINDTMMSHPIHLHGHFFELVTGKGGHAPRKHTVNVQPGGKVVFDATMDAPGDWAFHCHMQFHMHAGMFRVVSVRPLEQGA